MKRRRGDDDAKTHPHARALEPRAEGSADAIFRSFVKRAGGVPEVPPDSGTSPDQTPEDGFSLEDAVGEEPPPGDATDPRIPARWAETVEMLLEGREPRTEIASIARPEEPVGAPTPGDGVMLLTARKTAPPQTQAPTDDDEEEARTVAVPASLVARVRAAGPVIAEAPARIDAAPVMPELVRTVEHPRAAEHARKADAEWSERESAKMRRVRPESDDRPTELRERSSASGRIRAQLETPSEPIELRAPAKVPSQPPRKETPRADSPRAEPPRTEEAWESVVRAPSEITQRREALKLVPDVAQVSVTAPPPSERSEDGLIPSGLLDRTLGDMAVLLRYGHEAQARHELEQLRLRYPQDLLLVRRIAEFYLANDRAALALEQLFSLATGLFERRNVEGMRQALEQVLVIEPGNERATRLLSLLEQRPADPTGGRKSR